MQIVADVPMLEGIKVEWMLQSSCFPSAMTLSLAYDNYLRLMTLAEDECQSRSTLSLGGQLISLTDLMYHSYMGKMVVLSSRFVMRQCH